MDTVTLVYTGVGNSKTYNVLWVKGFSADDEIEFHNVIQRTSDDGTIYEYADSWRRVITVNFGVIASDVDREFLINWMNDPARTLSFNGATAKTVVPYDAGGYQNEWIEGMKEGKSYTLQFKERTTTSL